MAKKSKKSPKKQRWVVKVGSNMIFNGGPILMRAWMLQLFRLRTEKNIEVIWVTSGAIASAVLRTGFKKTKRTLPKNKLLALLANHF